MRVHLVLTWVWVALVPPTLLLWRNSIPWLVFMSIYAIIVGHWSGYQASRAEVNSPDADPD
jgi:hypothetical protein